VSAATMKELMARFNRDWCKNVDRTIGIH